MEISKRKKIEETVLSTIDMLDVTGLNTKQYKDLFDSMSDDKFEKYINNLLSDKDENFYMQILPFKNEPNLKDIKKAADYLGIPLEEYVYFRHDGNKEDPLKSRVKVPVLYLNIKRLQQFLFKKNSFGLDIDVRNQKTGQVTSDSKVSRISDAETYALSVIGADKALEELLGPRSDNAEKKRQMYQDIATQGYTQLETLTSDVEDSQTINTVDVYFMGAGIVTDLVTPGLALARTLKDKNTKDQIHEKYEK